MKAFLRIALGSLLCFCINLSVALNLSKQPEIEHYIKTLSQQYGFESSQLKKWFGQVKINQTVIKRMKTPYEAKPWYQYRDFFLTQKRIKQGKEFSQTHEKILQQVQAKYGVPAKVILAIIGVETFYGQFTGDYPVFDTLTTLAFYYPPREAFFRKELTQFLLLAREHGWNPLTIKGSYAGAMGLGQFMPSSYRHYAVKHHGNGKRNLFNNKADALASIANYLKENGWRKNEPIALPIQLSSKQAKHIEKFADKTLTIADWRKLGVPIKQSLADKMPARLLLTQVEKGHAYWLVLPNFDVLKRYNSSDNYALVIYTLAKKLSN